MYDNTPDRWAVVHDRHGRRGIMPAVLTPPPGWTPDGFEGTRADCARQVADSCRAAP